LQKNQYKISITNVIQCKTNSSSYWLTLSVMQLFCFKKDGFNTYRAQADNHIFIFATVTLDKA